MHLQQVTSVQATGAAAVTATHYNHPRSGETNVDLECVGLQGGITRDRHQHTRADTDRMAQEAGMKVHRHVIPQTRQHKQMPTFFRLLEAASQAWM